MGKWEALGRRMAAVVIAAVIVISGIGPPASTVAADEPMSSIQGQGASPTAESFDPEAIALLIQDFNPWYGLNAHDALNELGVHHDVINSSRLATWDLSRYQFIMYASAQDTSYYRNLRDNLDKISTFVSNGGLLIAHCCDWGWDGTGGWQGFSILPGGVTHLTLWDSWEYISQSIHIVEPEHGVVKSDEFTLTDDYLNGWGYSTHGIFTNLLPGTTVVMVSNEGDGGDGPTYIDYDYGAGKVLATMQTVEWGYFNGGRGWVGNRPEFLRNEIRFALKRSPIKKLPVPYYYQGNTDWCVPTAMSMIFKYYGQNIHSWDIAKDWGWTRDIEWWKFWTPLITTVRDYFEAHNLNTDTYYCSPLWPINYNDIFSTVKEWVDKDMPVLLVMSGIDHAVVISGYDATAGSEKVYISDPSGALINDNMHLSKPYPLIAVESAWNDVTPYIGWGSYLIAVSGEPQPPGGTIDIQDGGAYFCTADKPNSGQVYSWLYGQDNGLIWEHFPLHPLALNSRDWFQFSQYIVNHTQHEQTYKFEVEFAGAAFSTSLFFDVSVEGNSHNMDIMNPVPLRDLLQYPGEYTVTLRLWNIEHTKKYDEIIFPSLKYSPLIEFHLCSAADLYVTDPLGRHVGVDPTTGQLVNEIPSAIYSGPGSEPQLIAIPDPLEGNYVVLLIGTVTGTYSVTIELTTLEETISQTYTDEIVEDAFYVYSIIISDEARVVATNPDPVSELKYLKEFIMNLPDNCFDQSIRRASHLKKALCNKIDEVISKVEVADYLGAINKLSYDIRTKMDGDSTAKDWITDPTAQFRLCVIIDHIISDINILQGGSG